MKVQILCFLSLSCGAFSYSSDMRPHLDIAKEIYGQGDLKGSIWFLDEIINSDKIPSVDKVHYLILKHSFLYFCNDIYGQMITLYELDKICKADLECYEERRVFYHIN